MNNISKKERIKNYFSLYKLGTKDIANNAIVAALYAVLTYAFVFMSYGPIQFRLSEFMVLIVFFNPNYVVGLTLGCVLANIYSLVVSAFGYFDLIFGVLATLITCLLIPLCKHLLIASFIPAIFNGFLVSLEISFMESNFHPIFYFTNLGTVAIGEIVCVSIIGLITFYRFTKKHKETFIRITNAKIHLDYKW